MSECKHLYSDVRGHYRVGRAYCYNCQQYVLASEVINNFLKEMRKALGLKEEVP